MKPFKLVLIFTIVVTLTIIFSRSLYAAKWKGNWYLRGATECKEINLDRKGRTTLGVYPQALVEKRDKDYYLTVWSMGKKYSYKMNELEKTDYNLELISVGPNLPVPQVSDVEGAYSAIFRKLVDCQTLMAGGVKESPVK